MYICINEKRHRLLIDTLWQKKEQNERTLYCKTVKMGVRPPCPLYGTKIAGKIFFPTKCNQFIFNQILFTLNC